MFKGIKFAAAIAAALLAYTTTAVASDTNRAALKPGESHLYKHQKPLLVIEEYHLVHPGKEQAVIDYYLKFVEPVLRSIPGYMGMTILSPTSGSITNPKVAPYIGLPDTAIHPHLGIMLNGKVRTDRVINFHSGLKGEFNLMYRHYFADEKSFAQVMEGHDVPQGITDPATFPGRWRQMYGTNVWDVLAKEYFSMMDNHWDIVYRFVYSD